MATWNDWFVSAKEKGFPLEKFLKINQPEDLKRLKESNLPSYDSLVVDAGEYDSAEAIRFVKKHEFVWARVVDKKSRKRFVKLGINGFEEFSEFVKSLKLAKQCMEIQIFEFRANAFGGNVLVNKDNTFIEIAFGDWFAVGRGLGPFFHGKVSQTGKLEFKEKEVPEVIIVAARKVLSYLKKGRGEYMEGYFEFIISTDGKVFFMDYKVSFS